VCYMVCDSVLCVIWYVIVYCVCNVVCYVVCDSVLCVLCGM